MGEVSLTASLRQIIEETRVAVAALEVGVPPHIRATLDAIETARDRFALVVDLEKLRGSGAGFVGTKWIGARATPIRLPVAPRPLPLPRGPRVGGGAVGLAIGAALWIVTGDGGEPIVDLQPTVETMRGLVEKTMDLVEEGPDPETKRMARNGQAAPRVDRVIDHDGADAGKPSPVSRPPARPHTIVMSGGEGSGEEKKPSGSAEPTDTSDAADAAQIPKGDVLKVEGRSARSSDDSGGDVSGAALLASQVRIMTAPDEIAGAIVRRLRDDHDAAERIVRELTDYVMSYKQPPGTERLAVPFSLIVNGIARAMWPECQAARDYLRRGIFRSATFADNWAILDAALLCGSDLHQTETGRSMAARLYGELRQAGATDSSLSRINAVEQDVVERLRGVVETLRVEDLAEKISAPLSSPTDYAAFMPRLEALYTLVTLTVTPELPVIVAQAAEILPGVDLGPLGQLIESYTRASEYVNVRILDYILSVTERFAVPRRPRPPGFGDGISQEISNPRTALDTPRDQSIRDAAGRSERIREFVHYTVDKLNRSHDASYTRSVKAYGTGTASTMRRDYFVTSRLENDFYW